METTRKQKLVNLLKEAGYNQRQVSVRENPSSLEWSFAVTIRDEKVNYKTVQDIVKKSRSIDRCHASGEILSGGNTYVWLYISDRVQLIWAAKYLPLVTKAMQECVQGRYTAIDDRFQITRGYMHENRFEIYDNLADNRFPQMYYQPEAMAMDLFIASQQNQTVVSE